MSQVVFSAKGITKAFPGTLALQDVDFEVHAGAVNVLIGENGAGKSTLMKILAGVEQPTLGTMTMEGNSVRFDSIRDAASKGIGIVFQELNLCPNRVLRITRRTASSLPCLRPTRGGGGSGRRLRMPTSGGSPTFTR